MLKRLNDTASNPEHAGVCSGYFILFFNFLAAPRGMQNLSSPTRDLTGAPAVRAWSPNHWTAREFPAVVILDCGTLPNS